MIREALGGFMLVIGIIIGVGGLRGGSVVMDVVGASVALTGLFIIFGKS